MEQVFRQVAVGVAVSLCLGCSTRIQPLRSGPAQIESKTQAYDRLVNLPPPKAPVVVTVYHFRDQTGQYRPGRETTGWSTAVTQGATSMLIKALQDAGRGKWFTVVEREGQAEPGSRSERVRTQGWQDLPEGDAKDQLDPWIGEIPAR